MLERRVMVNKRMKADAVLRLARRHARRHGLRVEPLDGRGKGSHQVYVVRDKQTGEERGRFNLTRHGSKDVSWTVLNNIEAALAPTFGEKWMET